jgi:glycosyltransferase involved in cell wall biosynthesis
MRQGVYGDNARDLEEADVTIATSFETALPVHLHAKGRKFYFCQHFEPYFANEFDDPVLAQALARDSYRLPLNLIANSAWLAERLREAGREARVVHNAVDERMFVPRAPRDDRPLRLISYGGRGARWKGFADMVKGVALAREVLGDIEWSVYGPSEIPPDNPVAPYRSLGFLNQADLARAYGRSDIMVSASWYESFPLFPLEAMAAGAVAITTLPGAEAFARHMETAYVIPPQDPGAICEAIVTLARDRALSDRIAAAGREEAAKFSWRAAIDRMEQVLLASD